MAEGLPDDLARLLLAPDEPAREAAWAAFVQRYSPLLLHAARSRSADRESAMDAYAHILDRLRDDQFRRLRRYAATPGCQFSTWLIVVAQRLCVDYDRKRYGRAPDRDEDTESVERRARRRLVDLTAAEVDLETIADADSDGPEEQLREAELREALESALTALEPRDRLLLTLRFVDGLSAAEIAAIQNWPTPFHVYRRLNHLFVLLRQQLRGRGIEDPVR